MAGVHGAFLGFGRRKIDTLPIAFPLDCVWLQSLPESPLKTMIVRDAIAL
jgi:hypothetical protein